MAKTFHIPLKYKFLSVMLLVSYVGFGAFFYFAHGIFSKDKKLDVLALNLESLKATTAEVRLEVQGRVEELQVLLPRLYLLTPGTPLTSTNFQGGSESLSEEILSVAFFHRDEQGAFKKTKEFHHADTLRKHGITDAHLQEMEQQRPVRALATTGLGYELLNRSFRSSTGSDVAVLSVVLNGSFVQDDSKGMLIVVDFTQDFLRAKLRQSEFTQVFLMNRNGTILSHPDVRTIVDHAADPLQHPIVRKLSEKLFPRESFELEVGGQAYLGNIGETGFNNVFAVSQVRMQEAFSALRLLMKNMLLVSAIVLSASLFLSVLFAAGLTRNIKKLKEAADTVASGNWDVHLDVKSSDEIQSVAVSFQTMADRLNRMVEERAQKVRMEKELETAALVQSTLLASPEIQSKFFEIAPFYQPASECGGDFWDIYQAGSKVTLVVGDATGHGAAAAIVTAVAKSSFSTLNEIYQQDVLTPDQFLHVLNKTIFKLCKGQLLITMCVAQVDLSSGEILIGNAGHESPLRLKMGSGADRCDTLFARGERLGFSEESVYANERFQLEMGETLLLYTDGITEAINAGGNAFGERRLRKIFGGSAPERPLVEMAREIEGGAREYLGGAPVHDDITFVLFRWNQRAPTLGDLEPEAA